MSISSQMSKYATSFPYHVSAYEYNNAISHIKCRSPLQRGDRDDELWLFAKFSLHSSQTLHITYWPATSIAKP